MSFFNKLEASIDQNQTLLCVGLDPTLEKVPSRYVQGASPAVGDILTWNRAVIEATADLVCAYKPNIAFYEALGMPGLEVLEQTLALIPDAIPVILDAKRGDIGSTAAAYAQACFDGWGADAVTLSPYLGRDSIDPFAAYEGKGLFVLCHTSNPSADAFQKMLVSPQSRNLYLMVAEEATSWSPNVGLVVGATYPEALKAVRMVAPNAWFLVPGIGAQGGDLAQALSAGLRADGKGMIISSSRSITGAEDPRAAAKAVKEQMQQGIGTKEN